ncbi:MAG: polyphosphate polymerase domain-containing protein [Candidatus Woesebacteria bacterium]|jgi:SPX domain protein involved in polyphosphate accumulation
MAIEIFNRQELKFVVDANQASYIMQAIAEHVKPDKYNKNGQAYTLYNLYIDTEDHELIRHSLSKPVYKEKIRIRSYDNFDACDKVFLEIKKRYKRITNKRRTTIKYDDALKFIASGKPPKLQDYMNHQVVSELQAMLNAQQYVPKTFITYDRLAFFSKDSGSDLRVTFDTRLIARRFDKTDVNHLLEKDTYIMEIKSSFNMPLWLVEILSSQDIYKRSFSKYGREYLGHLQTQQTLLTGDIYA